MAELDEGSDEQWGLYDGQCCACDVLGPVDDMGLCEECGTKLERDLIRQRAWDYSASAFGLTEADREKLRQQVIAGHGQALELIAPAGSGRTDRTSRKRKRRTLR